MNPRARAQHLVVEEVGDELVVLDQERQIATSLNRTAAMVWRHCDGNTSLPALVLVLQQRLDPEADEDLVWLALDELSQANLLEDPIDRSSEDVRLSRRRFVNRLAVGAAAAVLLPEISTVFVPAAAQVKSAPPIPR